MKLIKTGSCMIGKIAALIVFIFTAVAVSAQSISLSAELEKSEIWLGDSVQFMLYLQGSEEAIAPELNIPGVRVEPLGGTVRSSSSITIINGKRTEDIRKAYVYGYRLTPVSAGQIIIPSISVNVEGTNVRTLPVSLEVRKPQYSDNFALELEFDRERVYLNEECALKIRFLYSESLRTLDISIPEIQNYKYTTVPGSSSSERYEINVNGNPVVFSKDDRAGYAGLSAVIKFRPATEGLIKLNNATASFESVTGSQRVRDFFGRIQNQEIYGRSVIPGAPAEIEVLQFPDENKTSDFFGLSGDIKLKLNVEPREAHVGDPLTLTLEVSGMNNPYIVIPPLMRFLGPGIDVPDTRAQAKIEGNRKTVTQTIRINDESLYEIPKIKFSYFDTESGEYRYSETEAVPMKILDTRIVTAAELEGGDEENTKPAKIILQSKRDGIYYNYSGKELLESQQYGTERLKNSILLKLLLLIPPALFIIIIIITAILPQMRLRAAAKADRRLALKKLMRSMKKTAVTDEKEYLRIFNLKMNDFMKDYGTPQDAENISAARERIDEVIYGRAETDADAAVQSVDAVLRLLERKEASNEITA